METNISFRRFRILDRFTLTGRGKAYVISDIGDGTVIHLNDVFYDSNDNRFSVKGLDIPRGYLGTRLILIMAPLDGTDVQGDYLILKK